MMSLIYPWWPRQRYVTLDQFNHAMQELNERLEHMATQADVDALTAQVTQVATDLDAAQSQIQTELDNLQAQITASGAAIDLTALQTAVSPLDDAVKALGALTPTPTPTPPPATP